MKENLFRISSFTQNIGYALFLIRMLFSLMYYPYVEVIGLISGIFIVTGVSIQFYISKQKSWIEFLGLFAVLIIGSSLMSPVLYPSISTFLAPFNLPSIIFLIASKYFSAKENEESPTLLENYTFGKSDFEETENVSNRTVKGNTRTEAISKILFYVFGAIGLLGLLFKFQHYPGASTMTIVGFGGTAISVLINTFKKK